MVSSTHRWEAMGLRRFYADCRRRWWTMKEDNDDGPQIWAITMEQERRTYMQLRDRKNSGNTPTRSQDGRKKAKKVKNKVEKTNFRSTDCYSGSKGRQTFTEMQNRFAEYIPTPPPLFCVKAAHSPPRFGSRNADVTTNPVLPTIKSLSLIPFIIEAELKASRYEISNKWSDFSAYHPHCLLRF
ncbi:hypothetical protein QE152_g8593 [Popillia japonica]|uniref:Uncharacterized protein n=1 Tax=Popillia japonica TaxID=7064 RepID=A0AAW1LXE2_POPJA